MEVSYFNMILIPVISGLIGWFTNWIAVKMLFRPKEKVNLLFFSIQGIFPKNQKSVAEKIGNMVATELFSSQDIRDRMSHPDNIDNIRMVIEEKINNYLNVTFPKNYPITSMFFGKKRKDRLKDDLVIEVEKAAPDVVERYVQDIEKTLNIKEIIAKKIAELPPEKLEEILNSILKKEFAFIEWIGGVIGLIIGILQVILVELL